MIDIHRSIIRPENITARHYRTLAITLVLFHLIIWGACYIISTLEGRVTEQIFFLSRAMSYDTARTVANVCMPFVAFAGLGITILRAVSLADKCVERRQRCALEVFLITGYILSASMVGVSAIPYSISKVAHLIAAGLVFSVGLVMVGASCLVDYWTSVSLEGIHKFRLFLFIAGLVSALVSGCAYFLLVQLSAAAEILGAVILVIFQISIARVETINPPESGDIEAASKAKTAAQLEQP